MLLLFFEKKRQPDSKKVLVSPFSEVPFNKKTLMYSNDKLRWYVFLFLTFCVLSSKNIIIYNEETLVALSFFCFFYFIYKYFGNTLEESLNERSQYIQQELSNFLNIKSLSFQELYQQHQKISVLVNAVTVLNTFTKNQLLGLKANGAHMLSTLCTQQIQHRLKTLGYSKYMLQQKLQSCIAENFLWNVLYTYHFSKQEATKTGIKSKDVKQKIIKQALGLLVSQAHVQK